MNMDLQLKTNIETAQLTNITKKWDGIDTVTTQDQQENEEKCAFYQIPNNLLSEEEQRKRYLSGYWNSNGEVQFMRNKHIAYLKRHLGDLGVRYMSQASRYIFIK